MIDDLDKVLENLLKREIPIKNREVEIAFDLPKREWSARMNRPTLNLFLHDIRENATLRRPEWQLQRSNGGGYTKQRAHARVDLRYMITAWAKRPEDEHHLLARTLMALYRFPFLPEDLLPEIFQGQPVPIPMRVADHDQLRNPADVWGALDNELRPAVTCVVTLALDPYEKITGPLVRTRELRFGQAAELPDFERLDEAADSDTLWMVGGEVQSEEPLANARLTLLEKGLRVRIQDEGRFVIGDLEKGDYTLELTVEGRKPSKHKITVPSNEGYDIEV